MRMVDALGGIIVAIAGVSFSLLEEGNPYSLILETSSRVFFCSKMFLPCKQYKQGMHE